MSSDKDKDRSNLAVINGSGGAQSKSYTEFDKLCASYGVTKAVARGVRTLLALPEDGKIGESDFVRALKQFTGQTPS